MVDQDSENFADLGGTRVNPSEDFSDLGGTRVAQAPAQSFFSMNNPIIQGTIGAGNMIQQASVGAGDAIKNTLGSLINNIASSGGKYGLQNTMKGVPALPQYNPIQPSDNENGTSPGAYEVGNFAGNIVPYMVGGEGLEAARVGMQNAPGIVGALAQQLGQQGISGVARRAIGNAAYSGLTAPDNQLQNAKTGAEWSIGADLVPGVAGLASKGLEYFQPQKYANKILDRLSGGIPLDQIPQTLFGYIKNAYNKNVENASDLYDSVRRAVPSGSIYTPIENKGVSSSQEIAPFSAPSPIIDSNLNAANENLVPERNPFYNKAANTEPTVGGQSTAAQNFPNLNGSYPNLPSNITNYDVDTLRDMHNKFIEDPSFQNAHDLQSQLGSRLREIQDTPFPDPATRNEINSLQTARNALIGSSPIKDAQGNVIGSTVTGDLGNFLNNISPDLAKQYQGASNNFLTNVVPYRNNSQISKIVSGDKENATPASLKTIFKAPDSDMMKVISDLPENSMEKVLFTQLKQKKDETNPFTMMTNFGGLNQSGLGQYITPELQQEMASLKNRTNVRSTLQSGVGALLGSKIGAAHGVAGAVGQGIAGAALASPLMNFLGRRLNLDPTAQAIGNVLRGTYPMGRSAILANQLNNSGVQNGS